jgi:pseudouridine synthase
MRYGVLHKPKGALTTAQDERGRSDTVYAYLPPEARQGWLFAVGRLDKDSEGLLLFTNDGPWSALLTGPESHPIKVYRVKLDLAAFRAGVVLDDRATLPCGVRQEAGNWVEVELREGRNRQIRRMFHALDYSVKRLIRIAIGPLRLAEDFPAGSFRWLEPAEAGALARPG